MNMGRPAVIAVMLFAFSGLGIRESKAATPKCIDTWTEAIYRNYGYDHIVHVRNRCERAAACDVSTDVNPEVQHVTVPPAHETAVQTFRGSPARVFVARVNCELGT